MKQNISESELEVMKVLWKVNQATSSEIIENLKDKSDEEKELMDEIKNNDYALTPGRYVGVEVDEEDDISFDEKMKMITSELSKQFEENNRLEKEIKNNLKAIGYEI